MRFISGLRAAAIAGALMLLPGAELAQAGGFGGGHGGGGGGFGGGFRGLPAVGVGAYARGQGPTGAAGLGLGANRHGVLNGFWGGGYGGGGGGDAVSMGNATSVYTYNHYDNRRRDGGFYGGGGVFYPDDGYSRLYTIRRPGGYDDDYPTYGPTGYAPQTVYRPSQHIFYLPDNNRGPTRKSARRNSVD
ncbi:hypothetical protein ACNHKD_12015 [Methylocystis sp. JAN1]|uniref:hypothetical protein n=1 Tax=Methylocystis sp. JAN1 TaxID=3397211 RepID=UPI003FA26EF6